MWLDRLERELDNIRAALDWCLMSGRVEDALRAVSSLERFWRAHGHVSEARQWLSHGLSVADGLPDDARADALWAAASQATAQSDWESAAPMLLEARTLFEQTGRAREEVFALSNLSFVSRMRDDVDAAERYAREAVSVAGALDDDRAQSAALMALGDVHTIQDQHELALARYEEAVALRKRLGDPLLVADGVYNLGLAAFHAGDLAHGRQAFEESLALARGVGEAPHIAAAQFMLADLDILAGDSSGAQERARESLALYTGLEDDRSRARCLVILAGAAAADGALEEAARLMGAAGALRADEAPDDFEQPLLDRFEPELVAALGVKRVGELGLEGARLGNEALASNIVTTGARE